MIEDCAKYVREVPPLSGRGHGAAQDTVGSELRESIAEVWLIDNPVKFESGAISVFGQFRRGCFHATYVLKTFDCEAKSAPVVFDFLFDFTKKKHRVLISDVLNILMASQASAEFFMTSLVPEQRVQSELSDRVKAVFGLQDEQVMEAVSEQARLRPVSERSNRDIRVAHGDTDKMRSMRSGFDSVHELLLVGSTEQLAHGWRADAVVSVAKSSRLTVDGWREATTPEGKTHCLQRPCSRVMVARALENEGSRLVRTWFPCGGFCGSLQQFRKGVEHWH